MIFLVIPVMIVGALYLMTIYYNAPNDDNMAGLADGILLIFVVLGTFTLSIIASTILRLISLKKYKIDIKWWDIIGFLFYFVFAYLVGVLEFHARWVDWVLIGVAFMPFTVSFYLLTDTYRSKK